MKKKIFNFIDDISSLKKIVDNIKKSNKKISLAHGVFDLIHYGHVVHLKKAKQISNFLIVSITSDTNVMKGPGKPIFPQSIRSNMLSALECVDLVIINHNKTPVDLIKFLKPNFYVKGPDYKNKGKDITKNIFLEEKAVKSNKGKLIITEDITYSSSKIINKHFNPYPENLMELINKIKKKYKYEDIEKILNKVEKLKILLIGDAIIDKYSYVKFLGHAGKVDIIPSKFVNSEEFNGGVLASARNLNELCRKVNLTTVVGKEFSQKNFKKLFKVKKNMKLSILVNSHFNTILKERFVNNITLNKVFEVYNNFPFIYDDNLKKKLYSKINSEIQKYDIVIVSDYGHGLLNNDLMNLIQKKSNFLAVNAQTNGGNRGFNLITKYNSADYYCLDLPEARLAVSDQDSSSKEITKKLAKRLKTNNLIVSMGKDGCLIYSKNNTINHYPAFNIKPIDTMGAGDAFLCISSVLNYLKTDTDLIGLLSNLYASIKVNIEGHRNQITINEFKKSIFYLIK